MMPAKVPFPTPGAPRKTKRRIGGAAIDSTQLPDYPRPGLTCVCRGWTGSVLVELELGVVVKIDLTDQQHKIARKHAPIFSAIDCTDKWTLINALCALSHWKKHAPPLILTVF